MILSATTSLLVLVDFQARILAAMHEAEAVLRNAQRLADAARLLDVPAWATEQYPDKLGPGDATVTSTVRGTWAKQDFGARDTPLAHTLASVAPDQHTLILAGCEAHICLLQTALSLRAHGMVVAVVEDACGSRTPRNHAMAMQRLQAEGCTIVTTEMVLFEWLGSAAHTHFKAVQALIR